MPRLGTAAAWRDAARTCLSQGIPPSEIVWLEEGADRGLFDHASPALHESNITISRHFVALAQSVVWHSDPQRFAHLYAMMWRLRSERHVIHDHGDAAVARLTRMAKNVQRCQHKMKAFVRFREIGEASDPRRSFAAWFEPTHHTVEPTAQFFRKRFGDMDWRIMTPDVSAFFVDGKLWFETDHAAPGLPDDGVEDLWVTYFKNIFNPARLKVQAMQSEMPKKYWKNMPEAAAIPQMIADAPRRAAAMAAAAPTLAPKRTVQIMAQQRLNQSAWVGPADQLARDVCACTRCPLHKAATQAVPGTGPMDASLMIVGEQPGDQEDLTGLPFVGPAGDVFDRALQASGLDRKTIYITNAVKHFKFTARGRRRIHQRPATSEINHCKWWLDAERAQIKPRIIVAMGATALQALTGDGRNVGARRGQLETGANGEMLMPTFHPAFLLRILDPEERARAVNAFHADLLAAKSLALGAPAQWITKAKD